MCKQNQRKIKELEKQVVELKEKITALEERVRDGKNLVVIDNACDICGEYADYIADGTDYCEEHFEEYLDSALEDMGIGTEGMDDINAKAEFLGVQVECIA